ncbi:hypothetical protein DNTS_003235 [Danionella cerebrum]|uniref:Interleukin-4 receptor alpha N-terminal domain-containing protein n=1 Tax=Danionella cerebrum TaxID=2873325 RepID=A0A553RQ38_9TELE|nr:hypothetical protein DNTS_003235 [Danionella translucida]
MRKYRHMTCSLSLLALFCQTLCYGSLLYSESTEKNLECFNDYETEIKCSFPSDSLTNCSGYKLQIVHPVGKMLKSFERSHHNTKCECKIQVIQGFVGEENFSTKLLEGTNVLLDKEFKTIEIIKPKTPNVSLLETGNGNFKVTWDDNYEKKSEFTKSLEFNLTYGVKGEYEMVSMILRNDDRFYDIVGSNLKPKTEYILTAKMSTCYHQYEKIWSDESEPVHFTSASSHNEVIATIVVPVLFITLFIICTVFYCFVRVKAKWWDKISKPKIESIFGEGKDQTLPSSFNKFSPIYIEVPKLDLQVETKLISALSVDSNTDRSSQSVESTPVDYGQAVSNSGSKVDDIRSCVARAMDQDLEFLFSTNVKPINKFPTMEYNSVTDTFTKEKNSANRDSGNCSGVSVFSNQSYLESAKDNSSFIENLSIGPPDNSKLSDFDTKQEDVIVCSKSQNNSTTEENLEDGYQSFNTVLNKEINPDTAKEFIRENLIPRSNQLYPPLIHHEVILICDDPYQALQDVSKNTEMQQSMSNTEQTLNQCGATKFPRDFKHQDMFQQSSWVSSLHTPPVIQTDCSYHAV